MAAPNHAPRSRGPREPTQPKLPPNDAGNVRLDKVISLTNPMIVAGGRLDHPSGVHGGRLRRRHGRGPRDGGTAGPGDGNPRSVPRSSPEPWTHNSSASAGGRANPSVGDESIYRSGMTIGSAIALGWRTNSARRAPSNDPAAPPVSAGRAGSTSPKTWTWTRARAERHGGGTSLRCGRTANRWNDGPPRCSPVRTAWWWCRVRPPDLSAAPTPTAPLRAPAGLDRCAAQAGLDRSAAPAGTARPSPRFDHRRSVSIRP
jgi:hypothetical protein